MKTLVATLLGATMLFAAPASAAELSGFYKWADDIVVKRETAGGIINGAQTIIVRVKPDWDSDDTPNAFRSWLPAYLGCTKYSEDLHSDDDWIKGLSIHVILADENVQIRHRTSGWVPVGGACDETLANIDSHVRGE